MTQEAFPANYTVPEVWTGPAEPPSGGSKLNSDTAGARRERELPRGEHAVQLYSLGTPNGRKVTILLEELGIEYDAYKINIGEGDQFDSDFGTASYASPNLGRTGVASCYMSRDRFSVFPHMTHLLS
ncbi:unnamed protein product [Chrysoparadoxa australica]